MHKQCCTPGPPAKEHVSEGKEVEIGGMGVYLNWPTGCTQAVVLASDAFGWKRPLLRQLADNIAAAGFVTVVPDYFRGDFIDSDTYTGVSQSSLDWLRRHPTEPAAAETSGVIKGLKEKGITSVGVAGFCFGGKVGVLLAKEGGLDATVILHPGLVTVDDIKAVKGPLAILAAQYDEITSAELVEQYKEYLDSQNEIKYLVKIFPGVAHGWSVRYDENDEKAVKSAYESHSDAISWFKKYLK